MHMSLSRLIGSARHKAGREPLKRRPFALCPDEGFEEVVDHVAHTDNNRPENARAPAICPKDVVGRSLRSPMNSPIISDAREEHLK